jgi:hypothetical protein
MESTSNSVTSRFAKVFDPSNASHVVWLGKFFDFAENLATKRLDIDTFLNSNPMGVVVARSEMLEWVQIHFTLAMKYTQAVFKGTAIIPGK